MALQHPSRDAITAGQQVISQTLDVLEAVEADRRILA